MGSFLEGLCIGLVIGVTVDLVIVVGVHCVRRSGPPPNEPPPGWCNTNTVTTNSLPATNSVLRLDAGTAPSWSAAPAPFESVFTATLQTRGQGEPWQDAYTLTGWESQTSRAIVVRDTNGVALLTNWCGMGTNWQTLHFLGQLPMPTNQPRYFRVRGEL
jgi:hypothetical protein